MTLQDETSRLRQPEMEPSYSRPNPTDPPHAPGFDYAALIADLRERNLKAQQTLAEIRRMDLTMRGVFHE